MKHSSSLPLTLAIVLVVGGSAAAQSGSGTTWTRGTTLNVFGGGAGAASSRGPAGGLGLGWELTPRLAVEGSATWMGLGADADAFTAAVKARINLARARPVVPFLTGGVGLYRASFQDVGSGNAMPRFYRRRLTEGGPGLGVSRSFTDAAVLAGGGVSVFLSRHIAIRPDVETIVVMRDSRAHVAAVAAVHLSYHFEEHPITPTRRR